MVRDVMLGFNINLGKPMEKLKGSNMCKTGYLWYYSKMIERECPKGSFSIHGLEEIGGWFRIGHGKLLKNI